MLTYMAQDGKGGTTTDGNNARDLLHNAVNRSIIVNEIPEHNRDMMTDFGQYLSVILRVLSSNNIILLENFHRVHNQHLGVPWISITTVLHEVLRHSWELMVKVSESWMKVEWKFATKLSEE